MRRTISLLAIVMAVVAGPAPMAQEGDAAPSIEVERAVVAAAVEDREPVGEATAFPEDVGQVIFHTTLRGDFTETTIEHVWSRGGDEMARVPLKVRGPRYRTWSSKSIPAAWAGAWTVKLVDADGAELASVDFTVGGTG